MRRQLCASLGAILITWSALAADVTGPETGPIATVNGQEIARDRFNALYAHAAGRLDDTPASVGRAIALKRSIARQLIDERLIEDEARKRGITATDAGVDRVLAELRRELGPDERWATYLRQRRGGLEELRRATRLRLITDTLASAISPVPVTSAEARAFYDKHRNRFEAPEAVVVHDLSFPLSPDTAAEPARAMRARATTAAKRLQKEPAPVVAKQVAGILRLLRLTAAEGPLGTAASQLPAGGVSDVLETGDALHVLKFVRRLPARTQTFEQARPEIEAAIQRQKRMIATSQVLTRLRGAAKIENHLQTRYANRRSLTIDPSSVVPRPGTPGKLPGSQP